jgi:hypothetical protein
MAHNRTLSVERMAIIDVMPGTRGHEDQGRKAFYLTVSNIQPEVILTGSRKRPRPRLSQGSLFVRQDNNNNNAIITSIGNATTVAVSFTGETLAFLQPTLHASSAMLTIRNASCFSRNNESVWVGIFQN